MSDLTEFLLARIAEDEEVARSARPHEYLTTRDERNVALCDANGYAHISATSGRVLAECEAKRRVVEIAQDSVKHRDEMRALMDRLGQEPGEAMHSYEGWTDGLMRSIAYLARPYADHPDYDESWRP